ncbi:MAG: GNAT family N-acetyltransferase [Alphaproteobacteria bacterium]|nr:GNAT family N-acetyltransferase [Alphaproteobacteria bacterium]
MPDFRILPFVSAYLPEATDLWVEAWTRAMPGTGFEARRVWFVDRLAQLNDGGATILCAFDVLDGRMAGLITLETDGHIDQLAVAVHVWGSGAATALLNEVKRMHAGGPLTLDVNQDNARAVRFYEREGFRRVDARRNATSGLPIWRYQWADISAVG